MERIITRRAVLLSAWLLGGALAAAAAGGGDSVAGVWPASPAAAGPGFDPASGAVKVSSDWKRTCFLLLADDEKTVVDVPALTDVPYGSAAGWVPPEGYGPKGFWRELRPGRYVLVAAAPGKKIARAAVVIRAGEEVWCRAELSEERGDIRVSEPLRHKTGPGWGKGVTVRWAGPGPSGR